MNCPLCRHATPVKSGSNLCKWHQDKKEKEERAAKGIAKQSAKEKERQKEYRPLAEQYKKEHPVCEAQLQGCRKRTTAVHHKKGRIGDLLVDVATFLATCDHCHHIIETHPEFAKAFGLSESRLNK